MPNIGTMKHGDTYGTLDKKGQAALEYLLLLGGAVLIAAIIIVIMASFGASGAPAHAEERYNEKWHTFWHSA